MASELYALLQMLPEKQLEDMCPLKSQFKSCRNVPSVQKVGFLSHLILKKKFYWYSNIITPFEGSPSWQIFGSKKIDRVGLKVTGHCKQFWIDVTYCLNFFSDGIGTMKGNQIFDLTTYANPRGLGTSIFYFYMLSTTTKTNLISLSGVDCINHKTPPLSVLRQIFC